MKRSIKKERSPERVKWIRARFESKCPQCKNGIHIGDKLGQPYETNEAGGNRFAGLWYCIKCAIKAQSLAYQYEETNLKYLPGWER